jgi:hypothetical protein
MDLLLFAPLKTGCFAERTWLGKGSGEAAVA